MSKLSESVTCKNFDSTVKMLTKRINEMIYVDPNLNPDEENIDAMYNKNFELLAHRFDDFSETSWFSKNSFDEACTQVDNLGEVLEGARDRLAEASKPTTDEEAQELIKAFEQAVTSAMDEQLPAIQATFSTGNELYALVYPYVLPLLEKLNHLYVDMTGGVLFDVMTKTPTREIQHTIQDKYKLFSDALDAKAPEVSPDDASANQGKNKLP